jgi:hypothetical protein
MEHHCHGCVCPGRRRASSDSRQHRSQPFRLHSDARQSNCPGADAEASDHQTLGFGSAIAGQDFDPWPVRSPLTRVSAWRPCRCPVTSSCRPTKRSNSVSSATNSRPRSAPSAPSPTTTTTSTPFLRVRLLVLLCLSGQSNACAPALLALPCHRHEALLAATNQPVSARAWPGYHQVTPVMLQARLPPH